jgi:hypothetical protein
MDFIVECPGDEYHLHFWTTVPVTTYYSMENGKLVHSGTGKVWTPHDKDEWFCQE